ncbi:LptF/LptG family permease [Parvularcula lutaonensis]|uniref:LptF/LptG family permease n=1 Tax=Parvularcula lutaonensis TaxID=491923 RepID=A0ABV7MC45_9PROT|nr:LptF/LptG family permease [Parvularcula lutaonensis]GGY39096.1 LPS export ABC transporter permease LptG [Parvularcula lutaonensis]
MIGLTPAERYLMGRTLKAVLVLGAASLGLTMSIDFLEALRQVSEYPGAGPLAAAQLTLLRSPQLLMILSPFIMLFGTLMAFAQLARSLEIAVFRAAGFSVWRIIGAPVWLALALGVALVTIVDPITTKMAYAADNKLAEYRGLRAETPRIFRDGVWLRQPQAGGDVLILHADDIDIETGRLTEAVVWRKTENGTFIERFDADEAVLDGGTLTLRDASRSVPGGELSQPVGDRAFPMSFALEDLAETGKRPEVLNIWNLPRLMKRIGDAGIPLEPYALRLHELIATPLKLASMAVLACVFALPIHSRGGGTAKLILQGIAAGFLAFILVQFSQAIGEAGLIPVRIAAWTPPLVTLLVGMTLILFREDG